jgi:hypothetical protein
MVNHRTTKNIVRKFPSIGLISVFNYRLHQIDRVLGENIIW